MKKIFGLLLILVCLASCASPQKPTSSLTNQRGETDDERMERAISDAHPSGKRILEVSKSMIDHQDIVIGGCWHYINAVYNNAGFFTKERETVFKSKFNGPYVDVSLIEAGDWLYFVNHTFKDIEHSAIFISWIDFDKKEALMVNYVGGNQKKPASYKRFVLDNVYNIFRGK